MNTTADKPPITPYWKPEPRRYSFSWWALLFPAIVYSVGVIVYAHNAFVPGLAHQNGHAFGSALMVFGGEAGTLAAAAEVFRKHANEEAKKLDWGGLFVSLVATLGNLFVVYVSLAPEFNAPWVGVVRNYGPLVLLICSGVDFYAGIMEFGFFNASFNKRYEKWLLDKHNDEERQKRNERARKLEEQAVIAQTLQEAQAEKQQERETKRKEREATKKAQWDAMSNQDRIIWLHNDNDELTQQAIADQVGCSRGYVSRVLATLSNDKAQISAKE